MLRDFHEGYVSGAHRHRRRVTCLHIPDVSHVFNYDLPNDAEDTCIALDGRRVLARKAMRLVLVVRIRISVPASRRISTPHSVLPVHSTAARLGRIEVAHKQRHRRFDGEPPPHNGRVRSRGRDPRQTRRLALWVVADVQRQTAVIIVRQRQRWRIVQLVSLIMPYRATSAMLSPWRVRQRFAAARRFVFFGGHE